MNKSLMHRLFFVSLSLCVFLSSYSQKQAVWIDADTGNEIDDVYAIIRLLNESSVSVAGISSAHFNNPDMLVLWDLALVEAYLKPEYVKIEDRNVPPENGNHNIKVYISIEADKLYDDFWNYINPKVRNQ